ncbi:MAG: acetylxylan esterase [Bacteroidota bacterium]|nr:acetylxylan esterase [Bacteroidota bacterium]MDP4226680.1 acetylxylan esterase [Bacteroidota bacterium]
MKYKYEFSKIPFHKIAFSVILFLSFQLSPLAAQENESWHASQKLIEQLSKQQPVTNYDEGKVPVFSLPDVLTTSTGMKVSQKDEWLKLRRPELLELFTSQVYGRVPATPYRKSIKVVKEDRGAMNGAATLKLVDITISAKNKSLTIHLGVFIPNKVLGPVPVFLLVCNRPPKNIDFTRENKSEFWPAEEVIARGYAIAAFYNADVDPDFDDHFQNGIHGLLDNGRSADSWGTIAAWAWGASRCLDYLVSDKDIAHDKIAVVGHSRGAKTALWAGATDQRFAMVVCNEAGCGGSSLSRRQYGETIDRINKTFPHWFCTNYKAYNNNEKSLPVDQHMLMALIAPRALYVASASQDLWGDPHGQYLALYHALPVFRLFEPNTRLPQTMPVLNMPVSSGKVAYHIREGIHNLTLQDWNFFMDYADAVFKR